MGPETSKGLALAGALTALLLVVSAGARTGPSHRHLLDAYYCDPAEELEFLLTFKSTRNFNTGSSMSTWGPGTSMCTDWAGVTCDDEGHVTRLNLRKEGLDGRLPDGFSCFGDLEQLTLGGNDFTGNLPAAWSAATSLTRIRLKNSALVGELPEEWSALGDMRTIAVSNNNLSGQFPEEWAAMESLKVLMAKKNMFTGELPEEYSTFEELETVTLQANSLQGESPFTGDVDIIFGSQSTSAPSPTYAPKKNCVYENEFWSMVPRPGVAAPGYHANYLGLVQCFVNCDAVDIIVWNMGTQYCQCWRTEDGFSVYTGEALGDTTFILALCDAPEAGDAMSLAVDPRAGYSGGFTRTSVVPSYEIDMFTKVLIEGFSI